MTNPLLSFNHHIGQPTHIRPQHSWAKRLFWNVCISQEEWECFSFFHQGIIKGDSILLTPFQSLDATVYIISEGSVKQIAGKPISVKTNGAFKKWFDTSLWSVLFLSILFFPCIFSFSFADVVKSHCKNGYYEMNSNFSDWWTVWNCHMVRFWNLYF